VRPAAPDEQAEVTLDIAALTNLWTSAASATQLSAWGMLAVADASVLARCALMFDMEKAPWCAEGY
jgi:predicted acetyltransferase